MKVKEVIFFLLFLSFSFTSCREKKSNNFHINQKLEGCWVGGLWQNDRLTEDVELRLFKIKPDSSLVFCLTYELGPRSRVWDYDIEISVQNHEISWLAHQGKLSENLDTMYLTKNWKGEQSKWMFYRDKSYDDFINKFISNTKNDYSYSMPASIQDGLSCESLDEVGIDSIKMTAFIKSIKSGNLGDIHSILIYRKGKLALEEYFALEGKISGSWVNQTYRKKPHQLSSVTKGILSLATGIAIDHGNIPGVSETIYTYLPRYANSLSDEKKHIQIKHLLTMTSGWDWNQFNYSWNDKRNDAANMYKCKDVVEYVLERPMNAVPGKKFNYSNADATLLGVVLRNACDREVDKYTESHLLNPIGITEYQWSRYPDGSLETDGGLKLCSRDLLKVGILMLNKGKWYGDQIISEKWVTESSKSSINLTTHRGYGYYWNEMKYEYSGKSQTAVFIPGDGGQFLAVFPSLDMVIAFTAGIYDKDPTRMYWAIINKDILPALKQ
jgi:CubicO group peptidase (beta-lactamase class C family)